MRKLGIYAVIVVLVGVVSSCLDDDNNYNYKQINEMQGGALNFENFNLDYSVIEGEELVLAPTFKFTGQSCGKSVRSLIADVLRRSCSDRGWIYLYVCRHTDWSRFPV